MLILFDIDATLVLTSRSGLWAMERAGRDLFGATFSIGDVEFAGRLDSIIIPEIFDRCGIEASENNLAAYQARYTDLLEARLADPTVVKTVLPGVSDLLAALHSRRAQGADLTIGLLTGNFKTTGLAKLHHCGLAPTPDRFVLGAFAEDARQHRSGGSRDDLPPVAMQRYKAMTGRSIEPAQVVIIGDSPWDVRCAKVNGCRALAVATGVHTPAELEACEPHRADLVVPDLRETERLVGWLCGTTVTD